ncbi:MAG: CARDB domain-containing protein, partial [Candidatus Thalassarchaeaceae archaeon]|nr:CARDB domain-containing protein [Candidatus Thalassarchaeaceae archaeon]
MMSLRGNASSARALIALMVLATLTPMMAGMTDSPAQEKTDFKPESLELGERIVSSTGARAPCPSTQNDGGTTGDAANSTSTTKTLGANPSTQNVPGCVDSSDLMDFYSVTLSANRDFSVELTVPSTADFDLYIVDSNSNVLQASEYNDPLENVMHITNASSTLYVVVSRYTGDGSYSLDMWTNTSVARPDLTSNSVSGPTSATTGSTVTISYTVNNVGAAALTSSTPYDIPVILSTDTTYDSTDTILSTQITGPNLAINANQQMNSNVQIPSSLSAGSYYWLVWPDGWDNVTESNELNNNAWSTTTTSITVPGLTG